MKEIDTTKLFYAFQECTRIENQQDKKYIMTYSGVSSYRIAKARKSFEEFNNLKVNEIIDIQEIINDIFDDYAGRFKYALQLEGELPEWKHFEIDLDTSQIYNDLLACLQVKDAKRTITALCSVSPYRMEKAIKSYDEFNNLKLNEVIEIGKIIDNIYNNVY